MKITLPTNIGKYHILKTILLIICFGLAAKPACSDTIFLNSSEPVRKVRIVGFKEGWLEALNQSTAERSRYKYNDILFLRVNGKPNFNDAEKTFQIGQLRKAQLSYQLALKLSTQKNGWLETWINVRRMNLLAKGGRIDKAVEIYLEMVNKNSDWLITVAPGKSDFKAKPKYLEIAADTLREARKKSESTRARQAIAKFYRKLGFDTESPTIAITTPSTLSQSDLEKKDQPGPWLGVWAKVKLNLGEADTVLQVLKRLYKTSLRQNLPMIFYWRGQALLMQQKYDEAGLNFMQIAIEFPANKLTPESLLLAGQAANKAGRREYAQKIWQELIDNFDNSSDYKIAKLVDQAKEFLRKNNQHPL